MLGGSTCTYFPAHSDRVCHVVVDNVDEHGREVHCDDVVQVALDTVPQRGFEQHQCAQLALVMCHQLGNNLGTFPAAVCGPRTRIGVALLHLFVKNAPEEALARSRGRGSQRDEACGCSCDGLGVVFKARINFSCNCSCHCI